MKPARRTLALLCLALAGLQGCSSPLRQPVLLPDMADAGAPAPMALDLELGERVHWRLEDGRAGRGFLVAATPDTLVLASRRIDLEVPGGWDQRLPVAKLVELKRWDPRGEPIVLGVLGVTLVTATVFVVALAISFSSSSGWSTY